MFETGTGAEIGIGEYLLVKDGVIGGTLETVGKEAWVSGFWTAAFVGAYLLVWCPLGEFWVGGTLTGGTWL